MLSHVSTTNYVGINFVMITCVLPCDKMCLSGAFWDVFASNPFKGYD